MQKYIKTPKHIYTEPKPESLLLNIIVIAMPITFIFLAFWLLSGQLNINL